MGSPSRFGLAPLGIACLVIVAAMAPAASVAQQTYSISGVVTNSVTGQPIARALVETQQDGVLTDNEGRFELQLPQGYSQLLVRRPGYSSDRQRAFYTLRVNRDLADVHLSLTPAASITGHVSVAEGENARDIVFSAYRRQTINGHVRWMNAGMAATTDNDGVFHMYEMEAPGQYLLCNNLVAMRPGPPGTNKPGYGYPSQCYPADPGDGTENLINLAAGQQADIDLPLVRQPFYPVTISVLNQLQEPGAQVAVHSRNGPLNGIPTRWNNQTHTAQTELPSGSYSAEARTWGKTMGYGRVDFTVEDASPPGLKVVILPLVPVPVRIHKEFTDPEQAQFRTDDRIRDDSNGVSIELMPVDDRMDRGGGRPVRRADPADRDSFELEGVTPGRYWVGASYFRRGYISAMTSGGVDLTREPLVIGAGNSVAPIEITLRNDGGEIDCTLATHPAASEPGANLSEIDSSDSTIQVFAIPAGPQGSRLPRALLQRSAQARIGNLPPGTYRVVAINAGIDPDALDPAALAQYADRGKVVTVPAGGTVNVQLDPPGSKSEGSGQ